MAVTMDTTLPTLEELETPEINLTYASLIAAANHMGAACLKEMDVRLSFLLILRFLSHVRLVLLLICQNILYIWLVLPFIPI